MNIQIVSSLVEKAWKSDVANGRAELRDSFLSKLLGENDNRKVVVSYAFVVFICLNLYYLLI